MGLGAKRKRALGTRSGLQTCPPQDRPLTTQGVKTFFCVFAKRHMGQHSRPFEHNWVGAREGRATETGQAKLARVDQAQSCAGRHQYQPPCLSRAQTAWIGARGRRPGRQAREHRPEPCPADGGQGPRGRQGPSKAGTCARNMDFRLPGAPAYPKRQERGWRAGLGFRV